MVDDLPSRPGIDDVESTVEDGNTQLPTPAPEAVLLVADGEDDTAADGVSSSSDDLRTAYDNSQPRDRTDEGPCLTRFTVNGLVYPVRSGQVRLFHNSLEIYLHCFYYQDPVET